MTITIQHFTLGFIPGFGTIGWPELLVIGIVAVILFGKRLPEVGRSLGKAIVEFKRGIYEMRREIDSAETAADQAAYLRSFESSAGQNQSSSTNNTASSSPETTSRASDLS